MKKIVMFVLVFIATMSFGIYANGQKEGAVDAVYPSKVVKVIVPYGAGGGTDSTGRLLMKEIEQITGESFNVENIAGASGTVGSTVVANAPADGYTLLFAPSDPLTTQPNLLNLPYTLDSFVTIAGFSANASVLAVRSDSKWNTIEDLMNEDKVIDRGHSGVGGISHICLSQFFDQANLEYRDIPFEGGALAIAALLGGHIDVVAGTAGAMIPYIESGEMRVLVVASEERTEMFPEIPTFIEKGFDISASVDWFLLAPKGTPEAIVKTLEKVSMEAASTEKFKEFVKGRGQELLVQDGAKMEAKIKKDYEMFKKILQ